jgi:hypothetical protein
VGLVYPVALLLIGAGALHQRLNACSAILVPAILSNLSLITRRGDGTMRKARGAAEFGAIVAIASFAALFQGANALGGLLNLAVVCVACGVIVGCIAYLGNLQNHH